MLIERIISFLLVLMLIGCLPFLDWREPLELDYKPPVLVGWEVVSAEKVRLEFNEEVVAMGNEKEFLLEASGTVVEMNYLNPMEPGKEVKGAIVVEDRFKNRLELLLSLYGYNPNVPELKLNELRLNGSGKRLDMAEMICLSSGSLAGVTFYRGLPGDYDFFFVFPNVQVEKGDYIVLHVAPTGDPSEINEVSRKDEASGLEVEANAWDFWLPKKEGLSGTNGVLSIAKAPGGELLDAIIYSNRNSLSDTTYRGFGSTTNLLRAEKLVELGHWKIANEEIAPEDCVNPSASTSTRTLCRDLIPTDTNSTSDWYVVNTSESSIGLPNSTNYYGNE